MSLFVILLIPAAFIAGFVLAKGISRKWLRWPLRGATFLSAGLTSLLLLFMIFGEYACTARAPATWSPDGKYAVVLRWSLQGALGADIATVDVRRRFSPFPKSVYVGPGVSPNAVEGIEPEIRWIGNKRLLVRYYDFPGYVQRCNSRVFDVEVICQHSPPPEPPPTQVPH